MGTNRVYELTKWALDVLLSAIMLLISLPVLLIVALLIKLDSPGPVLYKSERVGKNRKPFALLKFRTMLPSVEKSPRFKLSWRLEGDPRITRMGRFLRSTSLDEIPQIWNVLVGEMSLVGPRAEMPWFVSELRSVVPDYDLRHSVKPGITGLAQVSLPRYSSPVVKPELTFEYDRQYVQHRSILLDLKILVRTLPISLGLDALVVGHPISAGRAPLDSEWAQALESILQDDRERFSEVACDIARYLGSNIDLELTSWHRSNQRMDAFSFDTSIVFRDTELPRVLPIVSLFGTSLRKTDLPGLHRLLMSLDGSGQHIGLLLFFGDHLSLRTAVGLLETSMKRAYACDVIVLGLEELQSLMLQRDPQKELRRLVLSNVDLLSVSPFVTTGPTSDTMFFGREQELREIAEHAMTASYAVIGGRRIGKSSLIGRLHRDRLPAASFRALHYYCSTTMSYKAFLAATVRDWQPEPPQSPPATFGELLHSPPDDRPLVLLLDEADKLVPADRGVGWRLFNTLRALANSGHAQVVLSGERILRDVLRDPKSPLFNFANEIILGPLDYHAVEELITRPMKQLEIELVDEKAIVDCIWDFTSGHPNVVQRLCRRLIERLNEQGTRRITLDDVDAVIEDPGFQRDDFLSTYWEAATSLEKIISLLMADDENVRTLRTVRQALAERCNLRPKAREVDDALQRLVDLRSIFKHTPTGYEFAVEAFPRVVAGTMTLEDMLEVLVEDYAGEQAKGEA